jgi:hypothetical protein
MRRDPVVRENGVWFFGLSCVFKGVHVNPGGAKRLHGRVKFLSRHQRQCI